jgi:tetratricopeptide (TPR) repeat protein
MTKQIAIILLIILFNLFGCSQSKEEKVFKIFNEGVTFSLDAGKFMEEGNEEEGMKRYEMSIEKFKETLQIDSNHKGVPSALGHNYYETRNYDEAINWFTKAIEVQPEFAVNYQFLGFSQMNKGKIEEGEKNIEKAFEIDNSEDMRYNTISNLVHIGNLAYSYGEAYEEEGKKEQGNDYRKFGIRVLISALEYSNNDKEIGKMIDEYAIKMNDETLLNWVKDKMK